MSDNDFIKRAIESAFGTFMQLDQRHEELLKELDGIERQAAKLSLKMISLGRLYGGLPDDSPFAEILKRFGQMGLTEAVISVLKGSDDPLSTIQVRDQLIRLEFDLGRFKNALSAINTVLTRLPKEKVETSTDEKTGKTLYQWKRRSPTTWDNLRLLPRKEAKEVLTKAAKSAVAARRGSDKKSSLKN